MPTPVNQLTPIFSSPEEINNRADKTLIEGLLTQFPIENKDYIVSISNVRVDRKEFDKEDEKEAILKSKSLTYPVKGDITLTSKATGKVVDVEHNFPLMDAFHITGKHTLVYKGNNYVVANQLQLLPGCYTRTRDTGELETHINTGTGRSFKLFLDPQTELFYLSVGTSSTLLAPLLTTVFNVPHSMITKFIPKEIWDINEHASSGQVNKVVSSLYSRLVSTSLQTKGLSVDEMSAQLRQSLEGSSLSAKTTQITLGKSFDNVQAEVILRCMKNLVEVHKGDREEDNRDSLQFKRVQNLPDYLKTRFIKEHKTVAKVKDKIKFNLGRLDSSNPKIRSAISVKPWSKVYSNYVLESPLVSTPSETNPIESVENVGKVTVLGAAEGGISGEEGVPLSARNIDPSHLGVIDPSRTPESSHAGIDQRFTITARRDEEGTLYSRVVDNAGKEVYLSVPEMSAHVIGFPHQEGKDPVQAQVRGLLKQVARKEVEYWVPSATNLYTVTTNLVPFLNSNHPGRLTMAGKAIPQALSLVNREAPLVVTVGENGKPFVDTLAQLVSTTAKVNGTVERITDTHINIRDDEGKVHKHSLVRNLPFNMKGFMDDETPLVKVGDKVSKHQMLTDNNYTKDGKLSLGKNLTVAYVPYLGSNHEDGIVIREGAAKELTSHHSYKVDYEVVQDSVMKKVLLTRYYPQKFTREQLDNLDDKGFAKVGAVIKHGDPVYAVLEKREPTPEDRLLGRLHKSLVNPYRLATEIWLHDEPGTVVDAHTEGRDVRILLRSKKEFEIGDKLTGLHGNKGIASLIVPDSQMPFDEATGKPVDLVLNPASVTSRINFGQIMETVAGKIAAKTGKPYKVKNFGAENNLKTLKQELSKHGLSDTATIIDPKTGAKWNNVLTGPQYFLKLYKTTDSNYSARNVGGYDNNMQPTKGGEDGSKAVGWMEMLGLLGSDARHNLKEMATTKSEENTEYWSRFLLGQPLPKPKTTFATQKFLNYLNAAGIKTTFKDGAIHANPLTDRDILFQSKGELSNAGVLNARNMEPEDGGLFDISLTGGLKGKNWTHYKLAEPTVNPVFEAPVKTILGLTGTEFDNINSGKWGVHHIEKNKFHIVDTATGNKIKEHLI